MSDPYVTREMTVRDLLVHRSGLGLGAGDLLWWPASTYNRKEIARRLRYIPLATSFRSAYAYDNVLYLVAGEVIEAVSGQSWEDFVAVAHPGEGRDDGSNVRHSDAPTAAATSRRRTRRSTARCAPIEPFDSDNTNPAGGINSNAEDMAKWLRVQLARRPARRRHARSFSEQTCAAADHAGHADPDRRAARRSWRPLRAELQRLRARPRTCATIAATSC